MSAGVFDAAGRIVDEGTLTYDQVITYDRTALTSTYNYLAIGNNNNTAMGDNIVAATEWADVQATAAVPEPATLGLLGLAFGGLMMIRRRRK